MSSTGRRPLLLKQETATGNILTDLTLGVDDNFHGIINPLRKGVKSLVNLPQGKLMGNQRP